MNIEQANNSFQSMHLTGKDGPIPDYSWKMATVIGGAYFVFVAERLLKFVLDNRKVWYPAASKASKHDSFTILFVKRVILYRHF